MLPWDYKVGINKAKFSPSGVSELKASSEGGKKANP